MKFIYVFAVLSVMGLSCVTPVEAESTASRETKNTFSLDDLSGQMYMIHCASVERAQDILVKTVYRGSLDGPLWQKLLIYSYGGAAYRVVLVTASRTADVSSRVEEWVYEFKDDTREGWNVFDRDASPEEQRAFWSTYAEKYFHTTGRDLTELDVCTRID